MPDRKTYFEILTVVEPTPLNTDKVKALAECGNHLRGLAFDWTAADAHAVFAKAGIADGEPFEFARAVDLPGGRRDARFSIALTRPGAVPFVRVFAITHHTRDAVWRDDYLSHPNGASTISGLAGIGSEVPEIAEPWTSLFADQVVVDGNGVSIGTGTAEISFLNSQAFRDRFGRAASVEPVGLEVIEITVSDVGASRDHLEQAGIDYSITRSGGILTDRDPAIGVSFHFSSAPNADDTSVVIES